MRILFVEDELEKNIPRLLRLFGKFLSEDQKEELRFLENDEYGAKAEQVKAIMERKDLFRIEYRFPDALREIISHPDKYALFIIDRNLSLTEYDLAEVQAIDNNFSEAQYDKFFEREGDYFLHKLIYQNIDVATRLYFLTAYSFDNEIKGADDLKNHLEFKKFGRENFIEKANSNDIIRLRNVIENQPAFLIRHENLKYLEILKSRISEKASDLFWYILTTKDDERYIIDNLDKIRTLLLDNILFKIARALNAPRECWNEKRTDQIEFGKVINWISYKDPKTNKIINQFDSNTLIYNFIKSIKSIASDFGVHIDLNDQESTNGFQPTTDTVNALVYALKDIIVWFDGALPNTPDNR